PSETHAMLATLARVAALRRTCLFSGRGGGRGLWTGRPQSESWRDLLLL
ncbi:SUGCT isoform 9, partial [Pan troglodytes]